MEHKSPLASHHFASMIILWQNPPINKQSYTNNMNLWQTYLHKISIDRINIKVTKTVCTFTKEFAGCIMK